MTDYIDGRRQKQRRRINDITDGDTRHGIQDIELGNINYSTAGFYVMPDGKIYTELYLSDVPTDVLQISTEIINTSRTTLLNGKGKLLHVSNTGAGSTTIYLLSTDDVPNSANILWSNTLGVGESVDIWPNTALIGPIYATTAGGGETARITYLI